MAKIIQWITRLLFSRRKSKVEDILQEEVEIKNDAVVSLLLWELHNQQRS